MNIPDKAKTIYVAGPMRGYDCFNFKAFFHWAYELEKLGLDVTNPAQLDCEKMLSGWVYTEYQYPDVLLQDLRHVRSVDALFMLEGWRDSPGAKAEHAFAEALGKFIIYESS